MRLIELGVDQLDPPAEAHRVSFDEDAMLELMADIKANGLRQPIEVRPAGDRFEIIFGHRRWEAHRRLGLLTIHAIVKERADDTEAERSRFAENLMRADLSPMEEARAVDHAMVRLGITRENMARMLHRSPEWIDGRRALLAMPDELKSALHAREISTGAAIALAAVDDPAHLVYLLEHATRNGASIAVVRAWVQDYATQKAAAAGAPLPPPDTTKPPAAAIVVIPCAVCAAPHPHLELHVLRLCTTCLKEINR